MIHQAIDTAPLGPVVVATLDAPPAHIGLGARIERADTRAIVSRWRAAHYSPAAQLWTVTLDAPPVNGDYVIAWRTGDPEPLDFEVLVPLAYTSDPARRPTADE